jgi:poly-gamma-glutamate capsule biosynthesis protein CapA/YwtB (metallophosphatase superfamily)
MLRIRLIFMIIGASLLLSSYSFAQSNKNTTHEKIKLLFVGDIMGHGPQITSAYDAKTGTYNYNPCFKYVKPIIEQADLAIGNLEVTLPGTGKYTGYPMFRSPDALATAIKNAGFDVVVTSNNHSNDGGYVGIKHTIEVLKDLNLYQTGTFQNKDDKDVFYPLVVYKNGFKLIFLNYTYDTNGLPTPDPAVVNRIEQDAIQADIQDAKALKPDGIIVVMHWGLEYQLKENAVQRELTEMMYGAGADLVIGAHPHVVQPIRTENFKNAKGETVETVTAYSLGNFISNQQQTNTDGGIIFEIELLKDKKTKKLSIGNHAYIPVWRYIEGSGGKTTFYALPISAFENGTADELPLSSNSKAKMAAYAKTTRKNLNDNGAKERKVTLKDLGVKIANPSLGQIEANGFKQGAVPFSYALGGKMGGMNATKGGESMSVAYYLSLPVQRQMPVAVADTTKPGVETIFKYEPPTKKETAVKTENPTKTTTKRVNEKPTKEIPKAYFSPGITNKSENTAKNGEPEPPGKTAVFQPNPGKYTIQFQASRNLYPASGMPFTDVEVEQASNGYYRYYTGSAATLDEAQVLLTEVQAKGFKDAFITQKKVLQDIMQEPSFQTKGETTLSYKVQFQTAKNYYNIDKKLFTDVLVLDNDGLFKYYTGTAYSLSDADKLLKTVQGKGFTDAFIVTFENGKPK